MHINSTRIFDFLPENMQEENDAKFYKLIYLTFRAIVEYLMKTYIYIYIYVYVYIYTYTCIYYIYITFLAAASV